MYTSFIGRKFLQLYNKKQGKNYTAKDFFDKIFFPLFFDDERHLMHVGNSPFFQSVSKKELNKGLSKSEIQLLKLHRDIEKGPPNMAIFVGFAAKDIKATTSGQLTDIDFKISPEEMYYSWIGEALGIGISGGYIILFNNDSILMTIFEGWSEYRRYLNQTPNLKGRQIETWNGNWLYSKLANSKIDDIAHISERSSALEIPTIRWTKIILVLSKKFPNSKMTVYVYNLSQTNSTLGFINIYLPQIKSLYEFNDKIFINKKDFILTDNDIQKKIIPFFSFRMACQAGAIGLRSLEPKGLRAYMPKGTYKYSQGKNFNFSKDDSKNTFSIYKLWVNAMLNKTELLELADKLAKSVLDFENETRQSSRGKTSMNRELTKLLESRSIKTFIDGLTDALLSQPQNAETFKEIVNEVLTMPVDNFPLFLTLVRFEYNYQKHLQGDTK